MVLPNKREIPLPKGGVLSVEMNNEFLCRVRKQFMILEEDDVSDDHIRMFIFGAFKSAIDKAET